MNLSCLFSLIFIEILAHYSLPIISSAINGPKFENLQNCGIFKKSKANGLIAGGSEASRGQFPWQVSLQRRSGSIWYHVCGAVILNKDWLLSAAHCINGLDEMSLQAVVGAHLLGEPNDIQSGHRVSEILKHDSYNPLTLANDLALIRVNTSMNLDDSDGYKNGVCLPIAGQKFTQYVSLSGWGSTAPGGHKPSNALMFVKDVPIVSLPKCRSLYGSDAIREGMLCAGAQLDAPKGLCQGDSGGPLIQVAPNGRAVLVGIASFSRGCAPTNDGIPNVFVEVSYYRDWINSKAIEN